MAGLTPLPPHKLHSSTRLTHAQAHAHLARFLELAEDTARYRPDSTLTERGPVSAGVGAGPDLTLHQLRRILQGIEGRRVGGEGDVGRVFGDGAGVVGAARKRKREEEQREKELREQKNNGDRQAGEDGWRDKEDYDLAQEDDEVNLMDEARHPGANLEEPADVDEAEEMAEIRIEDSGQKVGLSSQQAEGSTVDKEARKKAKKDRAKAEKRAKEEAKAAAKAKT